MLMISIVLLATICCRFVSWTFLKLMLGWDSEDEICSRFVFEIVIWSQPSGPLCLWQCLSFNQSVRELLEAINSRDTETIKMRRINLIIERFLPKLRYLCEDSESGFLVRRKRPSRQSLYIWQRCFQSCCFFHLGWITRWSDIKVAAWEFGMWLRWIIRWSDI